MLKSKDTVFEFLIINVLTFTKKKIFELVYWFPTLIIARSARTRQGRNVKYFKYFTNVSEKTFQERLFVNAYIRTVNVTFNNQTTAKVKIRFHIN